LDLETNTERVLTLVGENMIKSEYERAKKELRQGKKLSLCIRGNYGEIIEHGVLVKIENDRVYLDHGFSHHYTRIISMS
jgi:hypothetical protein